MGTTTGIAAATPARWAIPARTWLLLGIGLVLACCWDRAAYLGLTISDPGRRAALERSDLYGTFRVAGSLWPWAVLAAAMTGIDASRRAADRDTGGGSGSLGIHAARRGVVVLLSASLSGAAAEVLKLVFRRLRPDATDGWYGFRGPLDAPLSTSGLGFPSSHEAVAFGACFALCSLFPGGSAVFVLLAAGCGLTRLLAGAHTLSDVYAAAVVGYAVAAGVRSVARRIETPRRSGGSGGTEGVKGV